MKLPQVTQSELPEESGVYYYSILLGKKLYGLQITNIVCKDSPPIQYILSPYQNIKHFILR